MKLEFLLPIDERHTYESMVGQLGHLIPLRLTWNGISSPPAKLHAVAMSQTHPDHLMLTAEVDFVLVNP